MLTKRQKQLLEFINATVCEKGFPPSFDEMKDALDLRSKSGIHRIILALEERGFIRRIPGRARAIEIVKDPGPSAYETLVSAHQKLRAENERLKQIVENYSAVMKRDGFRV